MKTELESLFYWLTQGNEKNLQLKRFIVNQRLYIRQSSIFFLKNFNLSNFIILALATYCFKLKIYLRLFKVY